MAMQQHLEFYQSLTDVELTAERTDLISKRKSYVSQSAGGKSYQQDLSRIDDQLQALTRVQNERGFTTSAVNDSRGTVDFSNR